MENNQNQKSGNSLGVLLLLIGLIIGAGGGYLFSKKSDTIGLGGVATTEIPNDYGSVNRINGLYVFIESTPVNKDKYTSIGVFEGNDFTDMTQKLGNLNGHVLDVFQQMISIGKGLSFEEKLNKLTQGVHEKYSDAEAIIIASTMTKCEVIKFN